MNHWIFEKIASSKEQIAIIYGERKHTYGYLHSLIDQYYQQLSKTIKVGSVVSIESDYNVNSIALFLALFKNKNVVVPITTQIKEDIIQKQNVSRCDFTISLENDHLKIKTLVQHKNEESQIIQNLKKEGASGLILFSSGTTGEPKAMIHNLDNLIDSYSNKKSKKIIFLIFLMFDHIGGINTLLNCLSMGVTMVFPVNRNPDYVCSIIEEHKVNILPASPTFLNLILISEAHIKYDLSSIRLITYGTEPMPESLLKNLKAAFPRVKFLQTFGTSETGITQTSSKSSTSTLIKIDDPNTEYKIVDSELWLRSKTQILGYLNFNMDRFTEDGWFKTGDLVEKSGDDYIKIIGRKTEMINVGGEKVLPAEVESVLFEIPEIKDCIVFAESNPITGQMVAVKVLLEKEMKTSEIKRIIVTFCKDKLERYKIPAKVIIMKESEYTSRFKKKRN